MTDAGRAIRRDALGAAPAGPPRRGLDLPGDVNMWVFVLGDLVIFGVYFIVFMVYRIHERSLFLESQRHLSLASGVVNTLVLLASSRFVALAVQAARAGNPRRAMRLTTCGGLCGLVFMLIKVFEWSSAASSGFTLQRNDFFMFYYTLTGVHLFHVLLGLVILAVVLRELRDPGLRRMSVVEAGAIYWHMVDLLWVVIFALLYVMR
jgi:nitric oxide reductase NorE protein